MNTKTNRLSFKVTLSIMALLVTTLLIGCQGASTKPLDKVTFMLEWSPNALHVPIIAGIEEGFFEKQGIDLELTYPGEAEDAIRMTAVAKSNFGLSMSGEFFPAVAGANYPIVGIAEFEPILPLGLTVLDPNLKVPDFKGKEFGIWSMPDSNICFDMLLASGSLTRNDVKVIDPGFDVVPPLLAGEVSGISSSPLYEQADCKRQSGTECPIFLYTDYGCGAQSAIIITNREWLKTNEDLARRFLAALTSSLKWTLENEDKAMEHWYKRYPEFDKARELEQWKMVQTTFVMPYTKDMGLGAWNMENMDFWAKVFYEGDYIPKQVNAADYITSDYLPKDKLVPSNIDALLAAQDTLLGH